MRTRLIQAFVGTNIGLVYWSAFNMVSSTKEPWDGTYYWSVAYPGSIAISAVLSLVFRRGAWVTGLSLTFAQFPIMVVNTAIGTSWFFGLALLGLLSLPLVLAAQMLSFRKRAIDSVGRDPR